MGRPKFYRPSAGNVISWEIYNKSNWQITFSPGSFEFQFNKWYSKNPKPFWFWPLWLILLLFVISPLVLLFWG